MNKGSAERASADRPVSETSIEELLTFERLLTDLSARLANFSGAAVESEIDAALAQLQAFLGFDRSNLFEFTADGWANILCSVSRDAVERHPLGPAPAFLKWYLGQVRAGNIMRVQSIEDLPPEAVEQIEYHRRVGIRSSLGLPLRVAGRIVGVVTFAAFSSTRKWPDDLIARLKVVGEVMAQALMRKRAETALQASEERWRSMFEASNLGITLIDLNLQYLGANQAFQTMLGYTEDELRTMTPLDVGLEDDRDQDEVRFAELKRGTRHHFESVKQYRRKDGKVVWGHSYLSVVQDTGTRPKMFIGTVIDVTETKQAQDALRETQLNLERVTRLTTMQTVAASLAHEMNQPLTAIVANGNAALRWLGRSPPEIGEAAANVRQIISDARRADQVVASVRGMFKKDVHAKAPISANDVVEEVLTLLRSDLSSKRISVRTELDQGLSEILVDRVQLQQVILNLIMNASESMGATPEGMRVLTIRSEASQPDAVVIAVEDTGPGIDAEDLDRIFDAFYTTKPQGMGMGLSICRSIVEAYGGKLWATARSPRGAIFYVKVPSIASPL
jgi:PAS domain S-box-containing protein